MPTAIEMPADRQIGLLLGTTWRIDRETGEIAQRDELNQLQAMVALYVKGQELPDIVTVTVGVKEKPSLSIATWIRCVGLCASPWAFEGRSGISWRAAALEAVRQPATIKEE